MQSKRLVLDSMDWQKKLKQDIEKDVAGCNKAVVLGVGNEFYAHDMGGLRVAEGIKTLVARHNAGEDKINVMIAGTAPENFTGAIRQSKPSHVVIIDAAEMGQDVGYTRTIDAGEIDGATVSSHNMKLSTLAGYLESEVGCRAVLIGIQQGVVPESSHIIEDISNIVYQEIIFAMEKSGK